MSQVCRRTHGGRLSPVSSLHIQPSRPLPSPLPFLPSPHSPRSCNLLTLFSDEAPMSFLQVFFQHLTQPKRSLRWCQAPGKSLLPWGPQASCHLLFAFHPPGSSCEGSASLLPSLLGPTCQGPPARCDHWVPPLSQTVDPGCASDPGFSKTLSAQSCGVYLTGHGSPWTETPAGPSLPCLCLFWNICSAAELLPPWNCLPQVIFQGIYQRRK